MSPNQEGGFPNWWSGAKALFDLFRKLSGAKLRRDRQNEREKHTVNKIKRTWSSGELLKGVTTTDRRYQMGKGGFSSSHGRHMLLL